MQICESCETPREVGDAMYGHVGVGSSPWEAGFLVQGQNQWRGWCAGCAVAGGRCTLLSSCRGSSLQDPVGLLSTLLQAISAVGLEGPIQGHLVQGVKSL